MFCSRTERKNDTHTLGIRIPYSPFDPLMNRRFASLVLCTVSCLCKPFQRSLSRGEVRPPPLPGGVFPRLRLQRYANFSDPPNFSQQKFEKSRFFVRTPYFISGARVVSNDYKGGKGRLCIPGGLRACRPISTCGPMPPSGERSFPAHRIPFRYPQDRHVTET